MADSLDTMMEPPVEELLDRCRSKFSLVTLASKRARQINQYWGQLGKRSAYGSETTDQVSRVSGGVIPPQVASTARKPLSIAFEEIAADKVEGRKSSPPVADEEPAEAVDSTDG